ncbi:MAG TPA: BBP7 family outer membrane beta-barrel protein, partial [Gemmataceae bacterium]|nr:BBP7 family outer membrane beta-barrel protein [Gemmataceae bacterium]
MNVRRLGPWLLFALLTGSAPAQDAPPLPPAPVPVPAESPLPPTSIVIEPAGPEPSPKTNEELPAVKALWRYGDGGEYLLWYIKNSRVPALVVGTPGGAVTGGNGGASPVHGLPDGRVLFGDTGVDMEDRSGGLFTLSMPLNEEKTIGFHGTYFFLGTRSVSFVGGGDGGPDSPTVGRPYVDALTGAGALRTVAAPGVADGVIHVALTSRLQGVEANGVGNVVGGEHYQIDLLSGFRFLQLAEGLEVLEKEQYLAGAGPLLAGTTFAGEDRISANTRFYGGQVGTRLEFRRAGAFMNFTGKLGFGDSVEVVRFSGTSITSGPDGRTVVGTGNLFSTRGNVGRYTHESFALLPELDLRVGYEMNEQARFFVGYTLLYLSDVVRPGDQIDGTLGTPPGGASRPLPLVRATDFWAQGLT